jgi:hypothetical protein
VRTAFASTAVVVMSFDQGEFNFDAEGSESGYRKWRQELDARKQEFEHRWGVVLGKRVKVWLKNHAKPVSGPLEWLTGKRYNPNDEPRFKVRSLEFVISEVESMVRDDED